MKNAVKLFLREWKYLLKRPRSLVLMVLVPIFVTCICGSGYGKGYFSDLKMGVVDYSYTKQTREVVEAFRQSPYFDVVGYYNDEDEIAEAMRDGEIVGCLIFPADFTRKMQLGQQAEVLLGSSAVNMGYGSTINLKGSEVLGTVSTQIAVKSLVAKGETVDDALATMNPVSFYTRQWYNPTNNFSYFLVYGFVAATVQQVLIYFAAISLVREKESGHLDEMQSISQKCPLAGACEMLGLFPDFPRGMGNLLRHHPLGLCDSHARKPSALVCLQQSFPAVDCCLGAVLFRGHAKSHCGNLYLSGVHLALSGAEWLHLAHHCVACVLSENRAGLSADAFCHRLSQSGIDGMWLFRSEKGAATSRRHHRGLPYAELRHLAAASEPH